MSYHFRSLANVVILDVLFYRIAHMRPIVFVITLAGIACIIMREVYATIGESIYPNPSFLSRDFPEASGRLLRNLKEFTFQDMAN